MGDDVVFPDGIPSEPEDSRRKSFLYGAVCRTEGVRRVIQEWNTLGLQKVTRVSARSTRGKMLRARIGEYGTEAVLEGNYEPYTPPAAGEGRKSHILKQKMI